MTYLTILRKASATGRLLCSNLKHKILQSLNNGGVRNLNSINKEPILKHKSFYVPKRTLFRLFRRDTKEQLKIKDNVPDQYILIYRSTMDRYILCAQIVTTVTAFIAVATTIYKHDFSDKKLDYSHLKSHPREVDNEIFVFVTAFVTIAVILQVMISRLPVRIYNLPQQKKYIFIFYGNLPFTKKRVICKRGDVIPLPETGIMPWRDGRYLIKDQQNLLLVEKYFRRPADLYIMLGVQSDPDADERK